MKKAVPLSIASIIVLVIVGYFIVTQYQLREYELEFMEELSKPRANLGFWNKTGKNLSIKLTYENGEIRWVSLTPGGGQFGSFDVGNILVEKKSGDTAVVIDKLILEKEANITFNVYEDRFEPR